MWGTCGSDLGNHKAIGFLGSTGPDPMKDHKSAKLDSSRPITTDSMFGKYCPARETPLEFRWQANGGQL